MDNLQKCPLCGSESSPFADGRYFDCPTCKGVFLGRGFYLSPEKEKARYEKHDNDVADEGYRNFVSPMVEAVLKNQTKRHKGLDFGAGPSSAASNLLRKKGYSIIEYDPYFHPFPKLLESTYDYIVCCEVVEHFFDPAKEFERLKRLLKPGGSLYCMTHLYDETIDFRNWYYRRDPTHVFIYRKETIEWIRDRCGFSGVCLENRLIVFRN